MTFQSCFFIDYFLSLFFALISLESDSQQATFQIPVQVEDRGFSNQLQLTDIGEFGIWRKARPKIPEHLHTGIDIKRPYENYEDARIYAIGQGVVISKRTDGPYAQLIIEHRSPNKTIWSLYEHIAEIQVEVNQPVDANTIVARFFNKSELDKYGWQFDHFHFEILKTEPIMAHPRAHQPDIRFRSRTLECYSEQELLQHFHDPISFFQ